MLEKVAISCSNIWTNFSELCRIQSYFEASIPVWDPKLRPQTLKSVDFWCKLSSPFIVTEPQEQCFELFRMQNSQHFPGFHPWTPLGKAYSAPQTHQLHNIFLLTILAEKSAPPKNCWIQHWWAENHNNLHLYFLYQKCHFDTN